MISNILILLGVFFITCIMFIAAGIRHGKFYFNHRTCITAGYLYYVLLPMLLLECRVSFSDTVYQTLEDYYMCIPAGNKMYYILVSFGWLAAFFIGGQCKRIRIARRFCLIDKESVNRSYRYLQKSIFLVMLLIGLLLVFRGRDQFFTGYAGDVTASVRGTLSAGLIMLCSFVLLNYFSGNIRGIRGLLKNKWGFYYLVFAFLVLTMGGRLYVVSNLAACMMAVTYLDGKGIPLQRLAGYFAAIAMAAGFIGIWRLYDLNGLSGTAGISIGSIFYNILQEPLYTNFSAVTYLRGEHIVNLISFPKVFFSSWINLVPSIIMPNKSSYILKAADMVKSIKSPLGAQHYFTSFHIDFGCLLAAFSFFLMGYGMSVLERKCKKQTSVYCTIYVLVSSNLMFTLYRDPFSVSIVKNIFEFSILIPAAVSWICTVITKRKGI